MTWGQLFLIWIWFIVFIVILGYKANNYKDYMRSKINLDRDDES